MKFEQIKLLFQNELQSLYRQEECNSLFMIALSYISSIKKSAYIWRKQEEVSAELIQKFQFIIEELKKGKPIQYIIGETEFYGLTFKVNQSVLIPRPETEELVDWIISLFKNRTHPLRILDIGTGSGCIAVALQKNLPQSIITAIDIAKDSLVLAKENAVLNGVKVDFIEDDALNIQQINLQQFDVIVSNPPYIRQSERTDMHTNVLDYEPHHALFVANENPLQFYEAIAGFAQNNLLPGGHLFFEINEYLGSAMVQLLQSKGFEDIELQQDMQGKDRMIKVGLTLH